MTTVSGPGIKSLRHFSIGRCGSGVSRDKRALMNSRGLRRCYSDITRIRHHQQKTRSYAAGFARDMRIRNASSAMTMLAKRP
jgi:hypothetical protein